SPGFWLDYCGGYNLVEDNWLLDGEFHGNQTSAVIIEMTPNVEISHNTISAPDPYITQSDGFGSTIYSYNGQNLSVHNNLVHGNMFAFAKYRGANFFSGDHEVKLTGMRITNNDFTIPQGAHQGIKNDSNPEASDISCLPPPMSPMPLAWTASIV